MNIIQKETREIKCQLTPEEHHEYSLQLAEGNKEKVAIENEKKSVMAQYKSKLEENEEKVQRLASLVQEGFETRSIECEVHFNKPEQGKKTIYRTDTGDEFAVERMMQSEWNLFSQADDGLSNMRIGE